MAAEALPSTMIEAKGAMTGPREVREAVETGTREGPALMGTRRIILATGEVAAETEGVDMAKTETMPHRR